MPHTQHARPMYIRLLSGPTTTLGLFLSHSTSCSPPPPPPAKGIDRMGTSVQVTPLSGAYGEGPLCYLLAVDGFRFLLDCGWTDLCDPSHLQPLAKVAPTIDAVLLSHADIMHLGALPYAMKHLGLSAPVYATEPVFRLGILTLYDYFISQRQVSDFDLFTLDDIDAAFQNVVRLKYSQNHLLNDKGEGIVIAPHVAGHDLGGTVWKITKDGEDVVYAVDFNHRKERHLNGTALGSFVRPAVLITDAYNALNNHVYKRQQDQDFIDALVKVLTGGGSVLLPIDTAGRGAGDGMDSMLDEGSARLLLDSTPSKGAGDGMDSMLDEGSARLLLDSTPSKVISNEMTVQVKCSLAYMDFEGRSDGRSVKSVIAHVAPLKLVLVHGSAEATEHLKMHCSKNSDLHVYAPQIEETIDVTSDLCAYKVQLSEKLMSNVISKKLGEHEIAWVDAEVGKADDKLTLLPPSSTPAAHKSVLVGDLKLADFKQFLANKGLQGSTGSQQIVIEGPLCEDYYKIRELLYSQFYLL
uniref:Cleavage and polyadenylation specificity factor subunit 2 n=1 Tax=Oryza meridionalis TaxID=40149 RepID=A0A0E0C6S1_9ORYZ